MSSRDFSLSISAADWIQQRWWLWERRTRVRMSGAWSFSHTLLLQIAKLYVLHAGPLATLAINAISGRLAAQGTSLKVNADHWGDKAKHCLFSKQQHITTERLYSQRTLWCNRISAMRVAKTLSSSGRNELFFFRVQYLFLRTDFTSIFLFLPFPLLFFLQYKNTVSSIQIN